MVSTGTFDAGSSCRGAIVTVGIVILVIAVGSSATRPREPAVTTLLVPLPPPALRGHLSLEAALRLVDMHDWHAEITDASARLRLSGGSVTIDLGLSATILDYIENGR